MKRYSNLYPQITSFENLLLSAKKAAKGKRYKPYVLRFNENLEENLIQIQQQLLEKTYTPGKYKKFLIYEPKKREISAAPFRDRVVHHALYAVIEAIFEKTFIATSFANRTGKGSHKAVTLFRQYAYQNQYALKCDIRKYFPSIDHEILKSLLRKKIKCKDTLWLMERIINYSNPQEPVYRYFPGDDLFTPYTRKKEIPIGNLTSQFFANIYLNPFDHYIKEELEKKFYIRYVDDSVTFSNDRQELEHLKQQLIEFLNNLRLKVHEKKFQILPTTGGISFLGYRIYPEHICLKSQNIYRYYRRMKTYSKQFNKRQVELAKIKASMMSFSGYCKYSSNAEIFNRVSAKVAI